MRLRLINRRALVVGAIFLLLSTGAFALKTWSDLRPLPTSLTLDASNARKVQILSREGTPLTITYQNRWNLHDYAELHQVPDFLQWAFIEAEDKRFYTHSGVDWLARAHALVQNIKSLSKVRGASTITEQVVRMLHTRPRTLWSRWLEGIEAGRLETRFSKADIFEFYLNQIPYASNRRGVTQAASYYFDRDLDTLNPKEMLALSVLIRAPSRLDLRRDKTRIEKPLARLAGRLLDDKALSKDEYRYLIDGELLLSESKLPVQATHFVKHIYKERLDGLQERGKLFTTIDISLQDKAQGILDSRLADLKERGVTDGAVIVVDHTTDEVLSWVNGGDFSDAKHASQIDAVTTPRQPGSTLKPLLYALAIERGWSAATLINDSPLTRPVGVGLHTYHNYSRENYGPLRLRDTLGNSLNIPAIRTVQYTGIEDFLSRLHRLGFVSLTRHPDHYGEGLALGNGEVTLLELAGAYAALARSGTYRSLRLVKDEATNASVKRVYSKETSSLIANILSDPEARRLEFGDGNLLRFPTQTAVKTGTSTDYRDAWAVGFTSRHTVAVWMGNLDQKPMKEVTGSTGPALVLRAVFAELNRHRVASPLYLSPKLKRVKICRISGERAASDCPSMSEWFEADKAPTRTCSIHDGNIHKDGIRYLSTEKQKNKTIPQLLQPTPGLRLTMDPRIPDELEAFALIIPEDSSARKVDWIVDGNIVGSTEKMEYLWKLSRGTHTALAKVWPGDGGSPVETKPVKFYVK